MSTFRAYLITPEVGPREYETARDRAMSRAREVGGSADLVELPATKAGLIPFLNELERHFATPAPGVLPNAPPAEPQPLEEAPRPAPAPILAPVNDDDVRLDARTLEAQVEALGAAGERGLDQVESLIASQGIGLAFSRGVHLLTILAAGEHQLSNILRRRRAS